MYVYRPPVTHNMLHIRTELMQFTKKSQVKKNVCVNDCSVKNCFQGILSVPFSINCIPMKQYCIQQYQYPGNFISKDRQLKQNWGQWNTKQRESHWQKHLKAWVWETCEEKEKDSDYISPVSDTHYCACVYKCICVCLSRCMFTKQYTSASAQRIIFVCPRMYGHICACCVCYAWRHMCSNRVVVDSDSCPVPFTAQSFQPPLCSVRLLMRINVLWRPLGLPHSPPTQPLMKKYNLAKILR